MPNKLSAKSKEFSKAKFPLFRYFMQTKGLCNRQTQKFIFIFPQRCFPKKCKSDYSLLVLVRIPAILRICRTGGTSRDISSYNMNSKTFYSRTFYRFFRRLLVGLQSSCAHWKDCDVNTLTKRVPFHSFLFSWNVFTCSFTFLCHNFVPRLPSCLRSSGANAWARNLQLKKRSHITFRFIATSHLKFFGMLFVVQKVFSFIVEFFANIPVGFRPSSAHWRNRNLENMAKSRRVSSHSFRNEMLRLLLSHSSIVAFVFLPHCFSQKLLYGLKPTGSASKTCNMSMLQRSQQVLFHACYFPCFLLCLTYGWRRHTQKTFNCKKLYWNQ